MEFFNKIKNSPYAEVLAEVAASSLAAGLYCKINPKANFDKSFALNMMVAVLSRIIKIERHTMQLSGHN